jgi:hypothetical protein
MQTVFPREKTVIPAGRKDKKIDGMGQTLPGIFLL